MYNLTHAVNFDSDEYDIFAPLHIKNTEKQCV